MTRGRKPGFRVTTGVGLSLHSSDNTALGHCSGCGVMVISCSKLGWLEQLARSVYLDSGNYELGEHKVVM